MLDKQEQGRKKLTIVTDVMSQLTGWVDKTGINKLEKRAGFGAKSIWQQAKRTVQQAVSRTALVPTRRFVY
ncbi:MAG: hypothetical protein GY941_29910 [Planctomycetes bacterium]|nr:hypothetical protein [Planctomycetota bacterium]